MNKQEIEKALSWFEPELNSQESAYAFAIANGQDTNKCFEDWLGYMRTAVECMEQQLTGGWIPVSERLPEESGHYLVTYHEWTDGNYLPKYDDTKVKILRYQDAIFKLPVRCDTQAEQDTHREVLAWRELPEIWRNNDELATDNNVVTKSGKGNNVKDADLSPEEAQELKAERDYWEREAKKWCAKLGEIRLLIGEQN